MLPLPHSITNGIILIKIETLRHAHGLLRLLMRSIVSFKLSAPYRSRLKISGVETIQNLAKRRDETM